MSYMDEMGFWDDSLAGRCNLCYSSGPCGCVADLQNVPLPTSGSGVSDSESQAVIIAASDCGNPRQ